MYRGTTPTYTFTMPSDVDISIASGIYVTFTRMDGKEIITKTDTDLNIVDNSIEVYLSQQETLLFPVGNVKVQLNWLYPEGSKTKRACSEIMTIYAKKNLIDEVLPNG